jgi:hypothetical protein
LIFFALDAGPLFRHSREGGNPEVYQLPDCCTLFHHWIPACAGMTGRPSAGPKLFKLSIPRHLNEISEI